MGDGLIEMEDLARVQEEAFVAARKEKAAQGALGVHSPLSGEDDESEVDGRRDNNSLDFDDQRDMAIMKQAVLEVGEDKFLSEGNVTALIEMEEADLPDSNIVMSMRNIHKTYLLGVEGVPALRGVSLSVKAGEFLVIFGTSGGGKTSLLNIMGTIDKPTKGNMSICGTRISKSTTDAELSDIRRTSLGFVFQTFNLLSSLTALENVMLPMILAGKLNAQERVERAKKLLTRVGMGQRFGHYPPMLSGGEQQRVTIARSIANEPKILLLDEPTGDLDTVNTLIVMKLLADLNLKDKITLIMVTHELALKAFAERVVWMRDGKIQTVQAIPENKRQDAFAKLEVDYAALGLNLEGESERPHEDTGDDIELQLAEKRNPYGIDDLNARTVTLSHTELRKPSDYHQVKIIYGQEGAASQSNKKKKTNSNARRRRAKDKGKAKEFEKEEEKEGELIPFTEMTNSNSNPELLVV